MNNTPIKNTYEEQFALRCLKHKDWLNKCISTEYEHINECPGGLSPLIEKTMLEDIATILPVSTDDVPGMIAYAHDMLSIAEKGCFVMPGCDPDLYNGRKFATSKAFDRMSAITAIWLVKFLRSTRKSPYKDIYAYLSRLHKLQWFLIRAFFFFYYDPSPDTVAKRTWQMLMEKYGRQWHDMEKFQHERIQIFFDIIHAYSFEYYPPYAEGELGQRGEYLGQD